MAVFYAVEQGINLQKDGERLVVKKEGRVLKTIHFHNLEQVILMGRICISPAVIATLLKRRIDTVFLTKTGKYLGRLASLIGKNIELRLTQFERIKDPQFRLTITKAIVKGKIENQQMLLRRINRKGLGLEDVILKLKGMAKRVEKEDDIEVLRGIEGIASRLYFSAYAAGFGKGIEFKGRERRPPKDPVNSLLSLGYTFLFSNVFSIINMVGLDPYLGCYHTVDYGRPSLALDLMEEWRPVIVDPLVLSVFNLKVLNKEDFTESEDGLFLSQDALRKFIVQFERKMGERVTHPFRETKIRYRSYIEAQVRSFVHVLRDEDTYKAAVFR